MNLNPYALVAIVFMGIAATVQYFFGTKQNRLLAFKLTSSLEQALKPSHTNYVNIGGAIGYNFAYALSGVWTNAKGTLTLSPRHSLFYFPISRLLGFNDRFFINLYTKRKLRGEAHIVDRKTLRRASIDGLEYMNRRDTEAGGKSFVLLWRGVDLSNEMEAILKALPDPRRLRHFCSFPDNKTFFFHTIPRKAALQEDIQALLPLLPRFLESAKEG